MGDIGSDPRQLTPETRSLQGTEEAQNERFTSTHEQSPIVVYSPFSDS